MPKHALIGKRIFTGTRFLENHAIVIDGDKIAAVIPSASLEPNLARTEIDGLIAPGFIDLQVNGGGGVLFNDSPDVATIRAIGTAHRRFGTTGFLPTLISDTPEKMAAAIAATAAAIEQRVPGVLGIHLEGPYLNTARRGIHAREQIRQPSEDTFALLTSLHNGVTLTTVAPEKVQPNFIKKLYNQHVIVFAGHSAATYEQTRAALAAGVMGFTHLFNAMPTMLNRKPGIVGAALEDSGSWCGLIVDGFHIHPAVLRIAIRAKQHGRMFLVTDAMPPVGTEMTEFELAGETIYCQDGKCNNAGGVLAGSVLDMASAVRNCVELVDVPMDETLRMAALYPAEILGMADVLGKLAVGYRANLVALGNDLEVLNTWIDGISSEPSPAKE